VVFERDNRPQGFHALADDVGQNVAPSHDAPRVPSPPQSVTVMHAERTGLDGTRRGKAALHRTPGTPTLASNLPPC
jgi:hypothetical protein